MNTRKLSPKNNPENGESLNVPAPAGLFLYSLAIKLSELYALGYGHARELALGAIASGQFSLQIRYP